MDAGGLGRLEKEQQMPFNKEAGEVDDTGLDISSKGRRTSRNVHACKCAKFKSKLSRCVCCVYCVSLRVHA